MKTIIIDYNDIDKYPFDSEDKNIMIEVRDCKFIFGGYETPFRYPTWEECRFHYTHSLILEIYKKSKN